MPAFADAFPTNVDRKMNLYELVRAIRMDMANELEAISLYMAHADSTDNELARTVLTDIANEERVHVGELTQLLKMLLADEAAFLQEGFDEVQELAAGVGASVSNEQSEAAPTLTVGSLKE